MTADEISEYQKQAATYGGIYLQSAIELIDRMADTLESVDPSAFSERVAGLREAKEAVAGFRARTLASAGIEEKEGGDSWSTT